MLELRLKFGIILLVKDNKSAKSFRDWLDGHTTLKGAEFIGYNVSEPDDEVDPAADPTSFWVTFENILMMTTVE